MILRIALLPLSIVLTACHDTPNQRITLERVLTPQIIPLHKPPSPKATTGLTIHVTGDLDGTATLSLMLNAKAYKNRRLQKDFTFTWRSEWYDDNATLIYRPLKVHKGRIDITYRFEEIEE